MGTAEHRAPVVLDRNEAAVLDRNKAGYAIWCVGGLLTRRTRGQWYAKGVPFSYRRKTRGRAYTPRTALRRLKRGADL